MPSLDIHDMQFETFLQALEQLPDTRDNRGKRHSLIFIVAAVIFAILEGKSSTSSLQRYIKDKIIWLKEMALFPLAWSIKII